MKIISFLVALCVGLSTSLFSPNHIHDPGTAENSIKGAWEYVNPETGEKVVALVGNSYSMATVYSGEPAKFIGTMGGPYTAKDGVHTQEFEFHTLDSTLIGKEISWGFQIEGNTLTTTDPETGETTAYQRVDSGNETDMVGVWRISGRERGGKMSEMKWGPRKTLKMITGTRFQWTAFNPETKQFRGTGGGTYSLEDGTYTENIEFFSRDNSRVGASLEFQAKISGKVWDHSGLSSKGTPIREIWKNVD
ncbi:MAG: membrane or secreted protein [Bacteroidota bacterium]